MSASTDKSSVSVIWELSNASKFADDKYARASLDSLLISCETYLEFNPNASIDFIAVGALNAFSHIEDIWAKSLEKTERLRVSMRYEREDFASYFQVKNIGAAKSIFPSLIFADSDVIFPHNYVAVMMNGLHTGENSVCYGRTYADDSQTSLTSKVTRHTWLFPVDPATADEQRNRWANSLACSSEVIHSLPFPNCDVQGYSCTEFKIERLIWERACDAKGFRAVEVETAAKHRQFDSLAKFLARNHVHGMTDILSRFLNQEKPFRVLKTCVKTKWHHRRRQTLAHWRAGSISLPLFLGVTSVSFLAEIAYISGRFRLAISRPVISLEPSIIYGSSAKLSSP